MKKVLLALSILPWLVMCSEDDPDGWHSGAEEELIAFMRRDIGNTFNTIYVMSPDGTNLRRYGNGGKYADRSLHWSPDGTSLTYLGDSDPGDDRLYIMSAEGLVEKLFAPHVWPLSFTWSPDGKYFAYASQHESFNRWYAYRIYVSPIENSTEAFRTRPLVDTIELWDGDPSWSPNGTKIAFSSDRGKDAGVSNDIYLMNPDGSELERLTWPPILKHRPVWSPDGKKIVFEGWAPENQSFSIYVMNADGSGISQVTHNLTTFECHCPTWSPDGTRVAFASDHEGNLEIYTINIDGTGLKRLTHYPGKDFSPSWSPRRRDDD